MKKFWPFGLGLGSAGSDKKLLSNSSNKGCCQQRTHFTVAFVMELPHPESTPLRRAVCIQWLGAMGVQKPGAVITTHDDSPQEVMTHLKKWCLSSRWLNSGRSPSASELPPGLTEAFIPAVPYPNFPFAPVLLPSFPSADVCTKSTPH